MKLYYSGAKELNGAMYTPEKSIGGLLSSTVIPNGQVNSIFSSFSNLTLQNPTPETKGIFIKNDFDYTVKNILVYCVYPLEPKVQMELAAVKGTELESLRSPYDTPYYADFYDVGVVYSFSTIKVIGSFFASETVDIEGVLIHVPNGTKEEFLTNAVKAFRTDVRYIAEVSELGDLIITYKNLGVYTNTPSITTYNSGTLSATDFGSGFDNSQLIAVDLKAGESIGIWLKRTLLDNIQPHKLEYYKKLNEEFIKADYGIVQNVETEKIQFCVEWSK